ncbi:MAG: vanadium-dependent haloperoxidase [Chitinophagaceae bacterium]|nr:vanadium-dependent haloperoxidase [Chitinophagaceae bacterium]
MEQKKTIAVVLLQKKKASKKWTKLLKPLDYLGIILMGSFFTGCSKNPVDPKSLNVFPNISNKVILDWNATALNALDAPNYQNVLTASRLYAMVHIAQYDALNSIKPVYERYCNNTSDAGAHPVAAAAVAAYTVLLNHVPAKKAMLDSALAKAIDTISNLEAKQKGIALGLQCGNAIIELRKNDGAFQDPIGAIAPSTVPGVYQAVPPFNFVFAPFWKTMRPFGLMQPEQFRSAPQPALSSAAYKKDFEEVKQLGDKNSTLRTAAQTIYANFWYEYAEIGWNRIASVAAGKEKTDLLTTARLFAMLNITLADSYTAGWDSKFYYNFWRPYTAVVNTPANSGGDELWEPLMPTPPVQDYPSTHSILGNAGARVLTYFYGDNYAFATISTSSVTPGEARSFKSFLKAADENADSRVMAGVHFRFSCIAGQEMGNKIGKWMIENL